MKHLFFCTLLMVLYLLPLLFSELTTVCHIIHILHYIIEIGIHISHLIRNRYK